MERIERPVLVLIDLQNDILKGKLASPGSDRHFGPMIANSQRLLEAARAKDVPVVFTRIAFRPGYVDANPHSPARKAGDLLLIDTWGGEIIDEVAPLPTEPVITKKRTSAFFASDLEIVLRGLRAESLILCGGATNRAVESTARDAHAYDYEVYVVSDACQAMKPEFHDASLRSMAEFFGGVYTTDEILEALGK
jgi:nicotinamidase-related amidase